MTRTATLIAAALLSACTSTDVIVWSSEGGNVHFDDKTGQIGDCNLWNDGGTMSTDCDGVEDEYTCDDDGVCSRAIGDIAAGDITFDSTIAVLTAEADDGYVFVGWDGCDNGGTFETSDDGTECHVIHKAGERYDLGLAQTEADANVIARFEAE